MLSERRQVFHEPTVRSRCGPGSHGMTARRQAVVVHAGFALGFLSVIFAILFGIPMLLPKFEGNNGQHEDTGASSSWYGAYHHQQQADVLAASRLWSCLLWVLYWPRVTGILFQESLAGLYRWLWHVQTGLGQRAIPFSSFGSSKLVSGLLVTSCVGGALCVAWCFWRVQQSYRKRSADLSEQDTHYKHQGSSEDKPGNKKKRSHGVRIAATAGPPPHHQSATGGIASQEDSTTSSNHDVLGKDSRSDGALPGRYKEGMGLNMSESASIPEPLAFLEKSDDAVSQADAPADATSGTSGPRDSSAALVQPPRPSSPSTDAKSQASVASDSLPTTFQSISHDSNPTITPTPTPTSTPTLNIPSTLVDTSGDAPHKSPSSVVPSSSPQSSPSTLSASPISAPATTSAADRSPGYPATALKTTPANPSSPTTAQGPAPAPITTDGSPVAMPGEAPTPPLAASGPSPVFGFGSTDADRHAGPPASTEAPEAQDAALLVPAVALPLPSSVVEAKPAVSPPNVGVEAAAPAKAEKP